MAAAEKHGMVHCAIGSKKLKTEYHLAVFKDKPNYTILGNLDLDENITADVERKLLCNEGDFTLVKSIKAPDEDYFLQKNILVKLVS